MIQRYAGDKITGLSTDTKPTNIKDGATFYETDTGKVYIKVDNQWQETGKININLQNDSYVLQLSDFRKLVQINKATANTLTIPNNSSVPFPIGTIVWVQQSGAGQTTLTPASGVTLNSFGNAYKLAGQYAMCVLVKTDTNTWQTEGNLTT